MASSSSRVSLLVLATLSVWFSGPFSAGETTATLPAPTDWQSEAFTRVLNWMKAHPSAAKTKERKDRLTMVFEDVRSIVQALKTLRPLAGQEDVVFRENP